jgi:vesicular inhibitory amino acid transporter
MASLPTNFVIGSAASGNSVRDAIASCGYTPGIITTPTNCHISDRRAQYLVAGSTVVSATDLSESLDDDEEAGISPIEERVDEEFDEHAAADDRTPRPQDDFISQFEWDDIEQEPPMVSDPKSSPSSPFLTPTAAVHETTPLLRRAVSFSLPHGHRRTSDLPAIKNLSRPLHDHVPSGVAPISRCRRLSSSSVKSLEHNYRGQSTFGQTVYSLNLISIVVTQRLIPDFSSSIP